jgi:hypothetical protein
LPETEWLDAVREGFPADFFEANRQAFAVGRASQMKSKTA